MKIVVFEGSAENFHHPKGEMRFLRRFMHPLCILAYIAYATITIVQSRVYLMFLLQGL